MIPEDQPPKKYFYKPHEGYESRIQHRIQADLGVDKTAAEIILHLRGRVIELQSHIRRLEAELITQEANQQLRLARYREVFFEATWIELEFYE